MCGALSIFWPWTRPGFGSRTREFGAFRSATRISRRLAFALYAGLAWGSCLKPPFYGPVLDRVSGTGAPGAEGLSGLANAFFFAGARGLIATHWFIPSEPAVEVTTGMVEAKVGNEKLNWAEAPRQSVLRLIDEPGPALNAHPIGWGAFIAVGVQP